MKELLLGLNACADGLSHVFAQIDRNALASGRLILTPRMLETAAEILVGERLCVRDPSIGEDGTISLNVHYNGMLLTYALKIRTLTIGAGRADGVISYTEQRRGGGLSSAILGLTSKSGLMVALSKYRWLKVDEREIIVCARSLPMSWKASFSGISPSGIFFRVG